MELPSPPLQNPTCRRGRARAGSLIVEAVIAAALLATAMFAVARLAKSSSALSQQADQRLAATLTAENTLTRLQAVDVDDLSEQAGSIADAMSKVSGCDVKVLIEPFNSSETRGIHLRVDVMPSQPIRVTLHDWRFVKEDPTSEGDDE